MTTATCTFYLDDEGFCRKVAVPHGVPGRAARAAQSCVGAQYLASLDLTSTSGLVDLPRAGASILLAQVDADGRASLVRTGVVTSFERLTRDDGQGRELDALDPFAQTDGVRTSAPPVLPQRLDLEAFPPPAPATFPEFEGLDASEDAPTVIVPRSGPTLVAHDEEDDLVATSEYKIAR